MKTNNLKRVAVVGMVLLMAGCGKSDTTPDPVPENTVLTGTGAELLMFSSMTGTPEGGIEGVESEKYLERHLRYMTSSIGYYIENSSLTFIGGTDKVKIFGYVHTGYSTFPGYPFIRTYNRIKAADGEVFQYKFEGDELKILIDPDKEEWVTMGYGNQEKIEVYIEAKHYLCGMGASATYPEPEDGYAWNYGLSTGTETYATVSPERATILIKNKDWQDFFDEIHSVWAIIPLMKEEAERLESPKNLILRREGVSWSVHKMTYLPQVVENGL